MSYWRNFGHLMLSFVFVLAGPEASFAYVKQCKNLWSEEFLPPVSATTEKSLEDAMKSYQTIMGFAEIGHKKTDIDAVKERLKTLPPEARKKIETLLRESYGSVKAFKYSENKAIKSFKRQLDVVLTEMTEASATIAKEYEKNGKLEVALDAYFTKVQKAADLPMRMKGEDVLLIALRLREQFFGARGKPGQGPIVLYGSFANGRSYPHSSDLDFAVLNAGLETRIRETDLIPQLMEFPFSDVEPHVVSPKQVHALGYLNNIVVLIKNSRIEVRVYHSHSSADFAQARSRFDVYYF